MIVKLVCAGADSFRKLYTPDENELLVGVDAGALSIIAAGYRPYLSIGDFDSGNLSEIARQSDLLMIYPTRKDFGDLELALQEIRTLKPEKVLVYNGTGGRLDHFIAALNLLVRYQDLNIEIIDERNSIMLLKESAKIEKGKYKYLSLFAVEEDTVISLSGFKYNLDHYSLSRFDNLCLSNEIETRGEIKTNKKLLLVRAI
ncbi:MAG TPA: thiamine diphosphokinase [Bacilli bacterium]